MMTDTLLLWIRVVFVMAAISVTSVPLMYARSAWRTHLLGRLFMLKSIAFAIAIDVRLLFMFWKPNILIVFWVTAISLTLVAIATASLAILIWNMRRAGRSR
jgi:hypothetical protein